MSLLDGKKVLCILAHSDDEIITAWPIMQDQNIDRYLMIVCDDVSRKGDNRLIALENVCRHFGIRLMVAGKIGSNFYALPTRYADFVFVDCIREIKAMIMQSLLDVKPDFVFTHNPVGFYGHGDHRLLFELVSQFPAAHDVIFTDLCVKNKCHRSYNAIPGSVLKAYYQDWLVRCVGLDRKFYMEGMDIYRQLRAWTWSTQLPVQTNCDLYIVEREMS